MSLMHLCSTWPTLDIGVDKTEAKDVTRESDELRPLFRLTSGLIKTSSESTEMVSSSSALPCSSSNASSSIVGVRFEVLWMFLLFRFLCSNIFMITFIARLTGLRLLLLLPFPLRKQCSSKACLISSSRLEVKTLRPWKPKASKMSRNRRFSESWFVSSEMKIV